MAHSTRTNSRAKPPERFPLYFHAGTKQWCKTVKKRRFYFGKDKDAALTEWLRVKEFILSGRQPPPKAENALTLVRLTNEFLTHSKAKLVAGELQERSFHDYYRTCERLLSHFGKHIPVEHIGASELIRYRRKLAEKRKTHALGNEIRRARIVFTFAFKSGLIQRPVNFGEFKPPAKHVYRKDKAERGNAGLTAWEIRRCVNGASPTLRAMVLLGINAGLGPADLAFLKTSHLDLERGWLDFPRPKTGIARRARLWPETIRTLRWALRVRPSPIDETLSDRVFLTKRRQAWVRGRLPSTALSHEFRKLTEAIGITRKGVGFYGLRRSFRTVADAARDPVAVDVVMGHADHTMGGQYRQNIEDKRLTRVAKLVRNWLWPMGGK